MPYSLEDTLSRLKKSKFRSSFRLSAKDKAYCREKGLKTIERHAHDFIRTRLADEYPANDGKQTPMSGHPVFKAMHATACCCRGCLERWYRVPKGKALSEEQQEKIVHLLMAWIDKELEDNKETR